MDMQSIAANEAIIFTGSPNKHHWREGTIAIERFTIVACGDEIKHMLDQLTKERDPIVLQTTEEIPLGTQLHIRQDTNVIPRAANVFAIVRMAEMDASQLTTIGVSLRALYAAIMRGEPFPIPGNRGFIVGRIERPGLGLVYLEIRDPAPDITLIAANPIFSVPIPPAGQGFMQGNPLFLFDSFLENMLNGTLELRISVYPPSIGYMAFDPNVIYRHQRLLTPPQTGGTHDPGTDRSEQA